MTYKSIFTVIISTLCAINTFSWGMDKSRQETFEERLKTYCFIQAIETGNLAKVKQSIEEDKIDINADVTSIHGSYLMLAVNKRHQDIVECLIQAGANINAINKWGETPLIVASRSDKYADIAHVLISANANVNIIDGFGNTALTYATNRGNAKLAHALYFNIHLS